MMNQPTPQRQPYRSPVPRPQTDPSLERVSPLARPRRGAFNRNIPERRKEPREKPRVFLLKWNNAHMKTQDPQKYTWRECWGTLYPNGRVSLDFGTPFASMTELRDYVGQAGVYLFQWLEDPGLVLGEPEGTAIPQESEGRR